jgi:hypothetical protein
MPFKHTFLTLSILMSIGNLPGQDSLNRQISFPSGIAIEYGLGSYSVKDEYISKEKYSGTLPYYSLSWMQHHDRYVFRLDMTYRNSGEIENYNVSTTITQFTLRQGFLYSLKNISLLQKELHIWFGPSTEFYFFYNDQNIAVAGFDYAQSFASLFSLGLDLYGIYPLWNQLQLESSLNFTVLSLGLRLVDTNEDEQSPVKLLTLFSGVNAGFDLGARYYFLHRLSVNLAYKFELTRISAWEPLLSASDNVIIGLTYSF